MQQNQLLSLLWWSFLWWFLFWLSFMLLNMLWLSMFSLCVQIIEAPYQILGFLPEVSHLCFLSDPPPQAKNANTKRKHIN